MTSLSEWIFGKAINRDTRHQLRAIRKQGMSDVEHSAKLVGIEMAIADIERRRAHQAEAERDTALARMAEMNKELRTARLRGEVDALTWVAYLMCHADTEVGPTGSPNRLAMLRRRSFLLLAEQEREKP